MEGEHKQRNWMVEPPTDRPVRVYADGNMISFTSVMLVPLSKPRNRKCFCFAQFQNLISLVVLYSAYGSSFLLVDVEVL